jgi:predicted dehydrogenase
MVGGGQGAFIGAVHRIAARLDDQYELVAGALSSEPERARASGLELGLREERAYGSFEEMARREARLKDGIEVVAIVTPNHMHFPVARVFLQRGMHVICDKPLTANLRDAKKLAELVRKSGKVFALTHNYTGYPLVRHARHLFQSGEMGIVRKVIVEYLQDWLVEPQEKRGSKQASWRVNPAESGIGGAIGDIGTHAFNLAEYVTCDRVTMIAAETGSDIWIIDLARQQLRVLQTLARERNAGAREIRGDGKRDFVDAGNERVAFQQRDRNRQHRPECTAPDHRVEALRSAVAANPGALRCLVACSYA